MCNLLENPIIYTFVKQKPCLHYEIKVLKYILLYLLGIQQLTLYYGHQYFHAEES